MSYKKYAEKARSLLNVKNPSLKQCIRKERDKKRSVMNRIYVDSEIDRRQCCEFCQNVFDHRVYQWHHIWDDDPNNIRISKLISRATRKKIDEEFKKVVLLCPNCHVTFHADLVCMLDHRKQREDGSYYNGYVNNKVENSQPEITILDFYNETN